MLGAKFYKDKFADEDYAKCAEWCNANNATIEDKGEYYECVELPAPSIEELLPAKLAEIDAWTANKISGGFWSEATGTKVWYDSDKDTQLTMQGIAINADHVQEHYPNGFPVRGVVEGDTEKTIQYFSGEAILQWQADLSNHIGNCKQNGWAKQNEAKNATTQAELDAIVLD